MVQEVGLLFILDGLSSSHFLHLSFLELEPLPLFRSSLRVIDVGGFDVVDGLSLYLKLVEIGDENLYHVFSHDEVSLQGQG